MLDIFLKFIFFIGIGLVWRFTKPLDISAEELRKTLLAVLYYIFLPALVISVIWHSKLSIHTVRALLVMLATTAVCLTVAWFVYKKINVSNNVKGSLIIAATFGSVIVIGGPISQAWVSNWTMRTAVYYEAIIFLPLLFSVGALLGTKLGSAGNRNLFVDFIKEPMILAVILGVTLNLTHVKLPLLIENWLNMTKLGVLPIGLIIVGLSLYWNQSWSRLIPSILPAVAIQLVLMPLVLWGFYHLFNAVGVQTFRAMFLQAAMPSLVLGFIFCERFSLDSDAYAAAFSIITILSIVTLPLWWILLKNGTIS